VSVLSHEAKALLKFTHEQVISSFSAGKQLVVLVRWFPKWAVRNSPQGGGEAEMGDWGVVNQKWAAGGR